MNSPVKYVPLTLLLNGSATLADAGLRSMLDSEADISLSQAGSVHGSTFEVVYRGATFRLTITPVTPDMKGFKKIFCNLDASVMGSAIELELSDHVAGGERVPAVMQALLGAARKLGTSLGAVGTIWHPANVVSGFDYFSEVVADYLNGGAFPVLALVNFKGGDNGTIETAGLSYVSGQELSITGDMEKNEIMRRVVRVAHDIAVNGPIPVGTKLSGIEIDEVLEFGPSRDLGRIRLDITSNMDA